MVPYSEWMAQMQIIMDVLKFLLVSPQGSQNAWSTDSTPRCNYLYCRLLSFHSFPPCCLLKVELFFTSKAVFLNFLLRNSFYILLFLHLSVCSGASP